jgi:ferredoxin
MYVCPSPGANVVSRDRTGRVVVSINRRKCLSCGSCVTACHHGARNFQDGLKRMLSDLQKGKNISLIVQSDIVTNFPDYLKIFRWLKNVGIKNIYNGALGVELFAWAHLKYLERYRPFSLITSYCPVVISYCRQRRPELIPRLSPIVSPLLAQTIYLKEHLNVTDSIGVLSPCVAAIANAAPGKGPDYSVTFKRLHEHIKANGIDLDQECASADPDEPPETPFLHLRPDLKKMIQTRLDTLIRVDTAQGSEVMKLIDRYADTGVEHLGAVFDLRYCRHGCSLGVGSCPETNFFKARTLLENARRSFGEADIISHIDRNFRLFEENLNAELFKDDYESPALSEPGVSAEEIENSFLLLGKDPGPARRVDCGYCGNKTCLGMAVSMAQKINLPENCVTFIRSRSEYEKSKSFTYLDLIQNVSEYLLLSPGADFDSNAEHALMALTYSMDGFSASLWKNVYDSEERPVCQRMITYPSKQINKNLVTVTLDDPPGWLDTLMEGNSIMHLKTNMNKVEREKFLGRNVNAILLTPILARGDFWGFISILKQEEKIFSDEDIAVVSICSNILASSLINQNLKDVFSAAKLKLL